jgi:hypothetical protein
MTYAETVFLFVLVIGFSVVGYLLYSVRQELEAIRLLLGDLRVTMTDEMGHALPSLPTPD